MKVMLVCIALIYPLAEFEISPGASDKVRRVVAIAVDGVREGEAAPVFDTLRRKMMELGLSSFWQGKDHGCVPSQPYNRSLPAYASIFSGQVQKEIVDNRFQGPLAHTTLFDLLPDSQLFSAWPAMRYAVSNDLATLSRAFISGLGNRPGEDIFVMQSFRLLHNFSNSFVFVHLGDADEYAHVNHWAGYNESIRREADYVHEIIQTSEIHAPKQTAYFVFADHGRGKTHWQEHNERIPESNTMWVLEINPAAAPIMTGACNHLELHRTMAGLLGVK